MEKITKNLQLSLLVIILVSTVIAVGIEIKTMFFNQSVTLADLLLMFLYLEVLAMVRVFWDQQSISITLPLLMPGILSGFMLAFVISIDDFIITLMVAGGGSTTLPVYIYSMVKMGVTPEVNAISSLLLAFSIFIVSVYWILNRKSS